TDTTRIFPPEPDVRYDRSPEEIAKEFGISVDAARWCREWTADGMPHYWKGENLLPGLRGDEWLDFRKKVRQRLTGEERHDTSLFATGPDALQAWFQELNEYPHATNRWPSN